VRKVIHIHHYYYVQENQMKTKYGPMAFTADAVLTVLTSGLWLIWIFAREMRNR